MIERKLIALYLILKNLGFEFQEITSHDFQQIFFLVQFAGIDLGYDFSWYTKGPYCPMVTNDFYDLRRLLDEKKIDIQKEALIPQTQETLKRVKPWLRIIQETLNRRKAKED